MHANGEVEMPSKVTVRRARKKKRQGQSPASQAGEFVREEMHHIREGKHGARSTQQAIAIGLSKARRAGVKLPPPAAGKASAETQESAERAYEAGQESPRHEPSTRRSAATRAALKREGVEAASPASLARQTRAAARRRTAKERSAAARKAARTKGQTERRAAARKAARTRSRQVHRA
jgi:hypothetical protein